MPDNCDAYEDFIPEELSVWSFTIPPPPPQYEPIAWEEIQRERTTTDDSAKQPGKLKCEHCQKGFVRQALHSYKDKYYCPDCFAKSFFFCSRCNHTYKKSELVKIDCYTFCKKCAKEERTKCKNCSRKIFKFQSCEYRKDYYCAVCERELFQNCSRCCTKILKTDIRRYQQEYLCPSCYNQRSYHNYDYKPKPRFYSTPKDKNEQLFFGIELEMEYYGNDEGCIFEVMNKLPPFVYAKSDGTINYGFEVVSHPATWGWLKQNYRKWENILNLRKVGFKSFNTETCGMHIHLSKNAFSSLHLYKILKFFYENKDYILRISQRKSNNLDRYATLSAHGDNSLVIKAMDKNQRMQKYTAINLLNEPTIEIRIFRGTLNPASFWKNLEFVRAVIEWTRNVSYQSVSVANFDSYVRKYRKDYVNLYNFIHRNRKNLQDQFERD